MALSHAAIEAMTQWCGNTPSLADERLRARRLFFGDDDGRPVKYLPGAETFIPRERRFLGWFTFSYRLVSGEKAGAVAARQMFRGSDLERALQSCEGVRYIMVIVRRVQLGSSFELELEDERFRVRFREMTYRLQQEDALVCHLLPARKDEWLITPGWLVLPFRFGPGIRASLRNYQWDPIQTERFLQGRQEPGEETAPAERPRDTSLAAAVARMTAAAEKARIPGLVLTQEEWERLLQPLIPTNNPGALGELVLERLGRDLPVEELDRWLGLAMNIWNNTPQPDRGGQSANQLVEAQGGLSTLSVDVTTFGPIGQRNRTRSRRQHK